MPRSKRRSSRRRTPAEQERGRSPLKGHATVWLATISTVVGVATGMFTLRDQVFPRESGTAAAGALPVYQAQIGRVCDELNADDQMRARETRKAEAKVDSARTTLTQRNAMLDAQRRTIARSSHALSRFTALETPTGLAVVSRSAEAAWERNLGRLRTYALKLDQAAGRPQVMQALAYLRDQRPRLSEDGVRLMSGLRHLGGTSCDIATPRVTRPFTVPVPKAERSHAKGSGDASGRGSSGGVTGGGSGISGGGDGPADTVTGATSGGGTGGTTGGGGSGIGGGIVTGGVANGGTGGTTGGATGGGTGGTTGAGGGGGSAP